MPSNIYIICNLDREEVEFTTFSDGCENCKIPPMGGPTSSARIVVEIEDCQRDVFRILLVNDALTRSGFKDICLTLDYMPNARADRVFCGGMAHPLRVTANLINSCNFKQVTISDPHSDVVEGVVDNTHIINQTESFLDNELLIKQYINGSYTLCSPDIGATKKTFDLAQTLGHDTFYQALKVRDVKTGQIVKCGLVENEVNGNVVIVDDISDGGASFIYLAKLLKERGADKVILYVTHGIFSKGLEPLKGIVDNIIVDNIVCNYITWEDLAEFNNQ